MPPAEQHGLGVAGRHTVGLEDVEQGAVRGGDVLQASDRRPQRWRGLTVGEFEQRQLRAIREELDRAHVERTRPAVRPNPSARPRRNYPARFGLDPRLRSKKSIASNSPSLNKLSRYRFGPRGSMVSGK